MILREASLFRRAEDARARSIEQEEERITRIRDRAQEARERALLRHRYRLEDIELNASRDIEDARNQVGHSFAQFNIRRAEIERDIARDREDAATRLERNLSEIQDDEQESRVDAEQEQADRIAEINDRLNRDLTLLAADRAYQLQQFDLQIQQDQQLRLLDHNQQLSDIDQAYAITSARRTEDLELAKFNIIQSSKRAELELTIQHHADIQELETNHTARIAEIYADLFNTIRQLGLPPEQRAYAETITDQALRGQRRALTERDLFGSGTVPLRLLQRRQQLEQELQAEISRPSYQIGGPIGQTRPGQIANLFTGVLEFGAAVLFRHFQRNPDDLLGPTSQRQNNAQALGPEPPIVIQGFDRESIRRAFLEVYDRGRRRGQLSGVT